MYTGIGRSLGTDYFLIADQLTDDELSYLRRTRDFATMKCCPVINGYWDSGDGSLGTFVGVQAGLAMQSIAMLGSEHQEQR